MTPTKSIAISLPYFCLLPINIDCIIIDYYIIDFCLLEDLIFCHIFHLETNKYCKHWLIWCNAMQWNEESHTDTVVIVLPMCNSKKASTISCNIAPDI